MTDNNPDSIIYVVDDEQAALKATDRLLRSVGYRTALFSDPRVFLKQVKPDARGCVILDVSMPGLGGLALQRELAGRGSLLPIIFLTGRADVPDSVRAMKGGASDFLTKPVDEAELLTAVREALARGVAAMRERAEAVMLGVRLNTLTTRERQVFERVVAGKLNRQVAVELGTVEKTIKVHRARVMRKMKADSLADLVRMAERAGIGVR